MHLRRKHEEIFIIKKVCKLIMLVNLIHFSKNKFVIQKNFWFVFQAYNAVIWLSTLNFFFDRIYTICQKNHFPSDSSSKILPDDAAI